jgi:hypothetical protein
MAQRGPQLLAGMARLARSTPRRGSTPPTVVHPLPALWRSSACGTPTPSSASSACGVVRGQPRHGASSPWRSPARGARRGMLSSARLALCGRWPVSVLAQHGKRSGAAVTRQVGLCALPPFLVRGLGSPSAACGHVTLVHVRSAQV